MNTKRWTRWAAAAAAALALAACGGGGGGIDGTGTGGTGGIGGIGGGGTGGIDGTGMSYGTITAFGSVWVNGVEFETDAIKDIRIDDKGGFTQADLRVGMVVRVEGSIDDRRANVIVVDDALKGRVERVLDDSRIVVMGQTVQYDNQTRFDDGGVRPRTGDYVEVHGLAASGGVVNAGLVQKKSRPAGALFEAKGVVTGQDAAARTLRIGSLTVDYSGATVDDSLPSGSWVGLQVEAKGSACAGTPVCSTLTASKVELGGNRLASSVTLAKVEIEGFVQSGTGASFVVGNQPVATTTSTVWEGGLPADLVAGAKVEVEGRVANGVLTAVKVSFRDNVRLEGDVASVNAGAGTVTLAGLPGVVVSTSSLTEFKDVAALNGLAVGYHLRIKARPGPAANQVLAMELELKDTRSDSRVEVQGPVSAKTGTTSLTILGVPVDNGTASEFRDLADNPMSRSAFYGAVGVGTLVKARGDLAGTAITWKQLELED